MPIRILTIIIVIALCVGGFFLLVPKDSTKPTPQDKQERQIDARELESRENMRLLGEAIGLYIRQYGKLPPKPSDLFETGLIPDFSLFVIPSSGKTITNTDDIDRLTDYAIATTITEDRPMKLVWEKDGSLNRETLVYFSDRTFNRDDHRKTSTAVARDTSPRTGKDEQNPQPRQKTVANQQLPKKLAQSRKESDSDRTDENIPEPNSSTHGRSSKQSVITVAQVIVNPAILRSREEHRFNAVPFKDAKILVDAMGERGFSLHSWHLNSTDDDDAQTIDFDFKNKEREQWKLLFSKTVVEFTDLVDELNDTGFKCVRYQEYQSGRYISHWRRDEPAIAQSTNSKPTEVVSDNPRLSKTPITITQLRNDMKLMDTRDNHAFKGLKKGDVEFVCRMLYVFGYEINSMIVRIVADKPVVDLYVKRGERTKWEFRINRSESKLKSLTVKMKENGFALAEVERYVIGGRQKIAALWRLATTEQEPKGNPADEESPTHAEPKVEGKPAGQIPGTVDPEPEETPAEEPNIRSR